MKHVILGHKWRFQEAPFPGYYIPYEAQIEAFGSFLLLVRNVRPVRSFKLIARYDQAMLYFGNNEGEADRIKREFDCWQSSEMRHAELSNPCETLPEGLFRIKDCPYRGLLIDEGSDTSDRCLLFFSVGSGHRGGAEIDFKYTNARLLSSVYSNSSVRVSLHSAVLLEPGQWIVCRSWGKEHNERIAYSWNGSVVKNTKLTSLNWRSSSHSHQVKPAVEPMVV